MIIFQYSNVLLGYWSNKCSFGKLKRLLSKRLKKLQLWKIRSQLLDCERLSQFIFHSVILFWGGDRLRYIPLIFHFKCLWEVRGHLFQNNYNRRISSGLPVWATCLGNLLEIILSLSTHVIPRVSPIFTCVNMFELAFLHINLNDAMKWVYVHKNPFSHSEKVIISFKSTRRIPFHFVHCVSLYLVIRLDN